MGTDFVSSLTPARCGFFFFPLCCRSRTSLVMEVAGDNGVPDHVLNRAKEITALRKKREQVNYQTDPSPMVFWEFDPRTPRASDSSASLTRTPSPQPLYHRLNEKVRGRELRPGVLQTGAP